MIVTKSKGTGSKPLYVGFFSAEVKMINPNKEQLSAWLGYELTEESKDIEYEGKSQTGGDEYVVIAPWVEACTPGKERFKIPFYLTDKPMIWPNSKKPQFVNQTGNDTTADSKELLPDWFCNFQEFDTKNNIGPKDVRQAIEGEANWYKFLRAWLSKVKFSDPTTRIWIEDTRRVFRNVDKYVNEEYRPLITATPEESIIGKVVVLAYVTSKEKDGEIVYKQKFYSEFLQPTTKDGSRWVDTMSLINTCIATKNWKPLHKFYEQLTGPYGCKDHYILGLLTKFNKEDFQAAGTETFIPPTEGADTPKPTDTAY